MVLQLILCKMLNKIIYVYRKGLKVFQITFCFYNPTNLAPVEIWRALEKFLLGTTNCGVNGKNSPSTPQIKVSTVNFC